MKCEVCKSVLEEYLDGELAEADSSQVAEHLITCTVCAAEFATLTAEQELFSRYDREIEVPPALWNAIAESTAPVQTQQSSKTGWLERLAGLFASPSFSFAGAVAVLLVAILIGLAYVVLKPPANKKTIAVRSEEPEKATQENQPQKDEKRLAVNDKQQRVPRFPARPKRSETKLPTVVDQSDVISTDFGFDLEDRDTARHLEQAQNLLRSIRNFKLPDTIDEEVDVSYDKALSRRLLNENIVLRRDAEMKSKFPTESLLSDVEPLLIDIANLPDRAKPEEVRQIQERVIKTEIVAALTEYQGRATDNR